MSDRYATWIRDQINDHAPSEDHAAMMRLAAACATLSTGSGMVFGMSMPAQLAQREELRDQALEMLRRWIPRLGPGAADQLGDLVARANLPIDLSARRDELAARRSAAVDAQLAQARAVDVRFTELERAICDDLDDVANYVVLADHLQREGDPRGELIALQLAGETDPKPFKASQKHLDAHHATLIGPLVPHQKVHDDSGEDAFIWRRGYIHRAKLSCPEDADTDAAVPDILELLLRHPSGRFLAELVIGMHGSFDSGLEDVVRTLAEHGAPALRMLHLGDFEYPDQSEISWFEVGDVSALWPAAPRLAHLIVQGASIRLGAIAHPALARLEIRTGGLPADAARAIATMQCPRLAHLDVWYGEENYGGDATIDDIAPLLARTDLPALRHLGLRNSELTDELCARLPRSPLLKQLAVLDLSMGTLSDDGAQAIAAHADAFRHLAEIDVSRTYVTPAGLAALRAIGPQVIASEMRDGEDEGEGYRYVAVGE